MLGRQIHSLKVLLHAKECARYLTHIIILFGAHNNTDKVFIFGSFLLM